jgi:hypothetical protein
MIAVDIETSCADGADYRFWRKGFKIDSIAASWRDNNGAVQSWYSDKPETIDSFIRRLADQRKPLVVHNLSFELGVFLKLYPDLEFNWAADTMRLVQLADAGGDWRTEVFKTADDVMDEILDGVSQSNGLSLEACASRFLGKKFQNHKDVAHDWLKEHHGIKSKFGQHLHLLPKDVLRAYNIADTETTLELYETMAKFHQDRNFDWSTDWLLYTTRCKLMQSAYIQGIKIDRIALNDQIYHTSSEIAAIERSFMEKTATERLKWAELTQNLPKSKRRQADDFNVGSNAQLKELFLGQLGIVTGKFTRAGEKKVEEGTMTPSEAALKYPSFASKHIKLYGPLGELLYTRRKLLLVLQQMLATYVMSEENGRASPDVRVSGTKTNRVSGGHYG